MSEQYLKAWLHLYRAPGLGYSAIRQLLDCFGDAPTILRQKQFPKSLGLSSAQQQYLSQCRDNDLSDVLRWLDKDYNHILPIDDDLYPPQLKATADPPVLLFIKGRVESLLLPQLAVVGSRRATRGGLDNARAFCYELAKKNWLITSGLAAGVDATAHRAALDAGG